MPDTQVKILIPLFLLFGMEKKSRKFWAQGSIEYLLLAGAAIALAIIVLNLLASLLNPTVGSSNDQYANSQCAIYGQVECNQKSTTVSGTVYYCCWSAPNNGCLANKGPTDPC